MATSETLDDAESIWKITGRYTVKNLTRLIATAPRTDLYINLRRRPRLWCDTYAYAFTRGGHKRHLLPLTGALVNDWEKTQRPTEIFMATKVEEWIRAGADVVPRFRYEPRVDGVRGYDRASYGGARQRTKYAARTVARRLAPALWI